MSSQIVNFRLPDPERWTTGAACAEPDAPLMFPYEADRAGIEDAKATCRRCPVRETCLNEALDNNETFGIWGGLTEGERRTRRRSEARARLRAANVAPDSIAPEATTDPYRRPLIG
jgi:WhiB family redox-sensing transcriptional regulator